MSTFGVFGWDIYEDQELRLLKRQKAEAIWEQIRLEFENSLLTQQLNKESARHVAEKEQYNNNRVRAFRAMYLKNRGKDGR